MQRNQKIGFTVPPVGRRQREGWDFFNQDTTGCWNVQADTAANIIKRNNDDEAVRLARAAGVQCKDNGDVLDKFGRRLKVNDYSSNLLFPNVKRYRDLVDAGEVNIRWVITCASGNRIMGRVLMGPCQGRFTHKSEREAQDLLEAMIKANSPDSLASVFGEAAIGTFEVRPVACYEIDGGDPKTMYFD